MLNSLIEEVLVRKHSKYDIEDDYDPVLLGETIGTGLAEGEILQKEITILSNTIDRIWELDRLKKTTMLSGRYDSNIRREINSSIKVIYAVLGLPADNISLEGEAMDKAKGLGNRIWSAIRKFFEQLMNVAKKYWLKASAWISKNDDKLEKDLDKLEKVSKLEKDIEVSKIPDDAHFLVNYYKYTGINYRDTNESKDIAASILSVSHLKVNSDKLEIEIKTDNKFKEIKDVNNLLKFKTKMPTEVREIIKKKKSAITFYLIGVVGKSVKIFAYCPKAVDSSSDKPYLKLPYYKVFSMEMGKLKKDKIPKLVPQDNKSLFKDLSESTNDTAYKYWASAKEWLTALKETDISDEIDSLYESLKEIKDDANEALKDDDDMAEKGEKAVAVKNIYIAAGNYVYASGSSLIDAYKKALTLSGFILKHYEVSDEDDDKSKEKETPKEDNPEENK
jgi:hypothetical protein